MTAWPSTLPPPLLDGNYTETPPVNTLRTPMDDGPAKLRTSTSANTRPLAFNLLLTTAQVATLDAFYVSYASSQFSYTHPRTNAAVTARFTAAPSYQTTDNLWIVAIALEVMP